ncbi:MAG: hypothetical protein HFI14_07070 [Lachnospiraceae bacterium]|nr:hypothetical protein [Lachnospiraceae bacterium]
MPKPTSSRPRQAAAKEPADARSSVPKAVTRHPRDTVFRTPHRSASRPTGICISIYG